MDKDTWNNIVGKSPTGHVLQSWQWGEFQKSRGRQIWRVALPAGIALVIKHALPFGYNYLYSSRGPVVSAKRPLTQDFRDFKKAVSQIAKKEHSLFWRFDPAWAGKDFDAQQFDLAKSPNQIQAANTAMLDLHLNEEEILNRMHHKARYNIKLAARKGVTIVKASDNSLTADFNRLNALTTARDKFKAHPAKHYQQMMTALGQDNILLLFGAKYKGKIIAAIMVSYFGHQAVYLHGVSDYQYRQLMAPHLLQWAAIKEAKKRGLTEYDFNGIAPEDQPKHPWAGITRFKLSFGSRRVNYVGGLDLVFRPTWYKMFCLAKKFKGA